MAQVNLADLYTATKKTNVIYSDIMGDFNVHPDTGQLIVVTNQNAVKNSLINLCNLNKYDLFHEQDKGANIRNLLFENPSVELQLTLENSIKELIENYEPRASLAGRGVDVAISPDGLTYSISITFTTINNPTPQTISVFLKRVR